MIASVMLVPYAFASPIKSESSSFISLIFIWSMTAVILASVDEILAIDDWISGIVPFSAS
jgi:hypothetical protein